MFLDLKISHVFFPHEDANITKKEVTFTFGFCNDHKRKMLLHLHECIAYYQSS